MAVIQCPECGKSLKVSDTFAGKRVRCPVCQKPFVVPDAADEVEEVEEVEEVQEAHPAKRPRRDADEDEDRRRPVVPVRKRKSVRAVRAGDAHATRIEMKSFPPASAGLRHPIVLPLCAQLIGFILGRVAMSKAEAEMARLPGGKRYRNAHKSLQLAKTIGVVGMCLSGVFLIVGVVLRIVSLKH